MTQEKMLKAITDTALLEIDKDLVLSCAVLEDETRVLSERTVIKALGGKRGGSHWKRMKENPDGAYLPIYVSASNLKPFINDELALALNEPLLFVPKGGKTAFGLKAEMLPEICDVWLKARDARILKGRQHQIAEKADMLMRAFAKVGIIALIDEATGYQYQRDRFALNNLLAIYLSEERLKWAKTFPDIFYRLIYKLKGWSYPSGTQKSQIIGNITNQLIYDKLPPGVLPKLRELNPKDPKTGRRRAKFFQHLSADVGQPDLRDHLLQVIALLRAAPNWRVFDRLFKRAFPTHAELEEQRQQRLPGVPEPEDEY